MSSKKKTCYAYGCDKEGTILFQGKLLCAEHYSKITAAHEKFIEIKCYFKNVKNVVD